MTNEMTTFWRFLTEHTIEIPIIQRDYAQGRHGKEELRKTFLKDLKQALDSSRKLRLDFVYGATENGALNLLDGQQRLTTLWLLHWYLAYISGAMDKGTKEILAKFSYETRVSSREFCKCLAAFDKLPPDGAGITEHIKNQTWFRSSWKNDPTIQSMLCMLGGSESNSKDGIEGVFSACQDGEHIECRLDKCLYAGYWEKLIGADCPIVFYYLDIHGIRQTDDLYIKMNARGRPLTSFENLKADLEGYVREKQNQESDKKGPWHILANETNGFSIKMDTEWMGLFWANQSTDHAVDEICFAFLNRYFFNAYVIQMKTSSEPRKGDDIVFDFLYGRNSTSDDSDAKIAYYGFDEVYKTVLEGDQSLLVRLKETLDNYWCFASSKTEINFSPGWAIEDRDFQFLPYYIKTDAEIPPTDFAGNRIRKIGHITLSQRIVFHAICKFFEQGWREDEEQALKDWIRVVWNIVENSDITVIGCLKLIDDLSASSHNILQELKARVKKLKLLEGTTTSATRQVNEEIEKADKILENRGEWEGKIRSAEGYAFFKGAIRFLYQDENGKVDWSSFDTKFANAKAFFVPEGVSDKYREKATLLRVLLSRMDNVEDDFWFGNGYGFWRNTVLLEKSFCEVVHKLLQGGPDISINEQCPDWIKDKTFLADVIKGNREWHILSNWRDSHKTLTLYRNKVSGNTSYPEQIIPLDLHRNDLLANMESEQRRGKKYFIGWDANINFKYQGYNFQWYGKPDRKKGNFDVYLMDDDWEYQPSPTYNEQINNDFVNYYCFDVPKGLSQKEFTQKLDKLIEWFLSDVIERIKWSAKLRLDWLVFEERAIALQGTENGSRIADYVLTAALEGFALGTGKEEVVTGISTQLSRKPFPNFGQFVTEIEQKCTAEIKALANARAIEESKVSADVVFADLKTNLLLVAPPNSLLIKEKMAIQTRIKARINYSSFSKRAKAEDLIKGEKLLDRAFETIVELFTKIEDHNRMVAVLKSMMALDTSPSWLDDLVREGLNNCKIERCALEAKEIGIHLGKSVDDLERLVNLRLEH